MIMSTAWRAERLSASLVVVAVGGMGCERSVTELPGFTSMLDAMFLGRCAREGG